MWVPRSFKFYRMLILRRKIFSSNINFKVANGLITNYYSSPKIVRDYIMEDDLSKLDNVGNYHGDRNIPKDKRITKQDKDKYRKLVKNSNGQFYLELDN